MDRLHVLKAVKKLQETTGLNMAECLKALKNANFDMAKVVQKLKEQGLLKGAMQFSSSAECTEGQVIVIDVSTIPRQIGLLKVACESDCVARSREFNNLCHIVKKQAEDKILITAKDILESAYQGEPMQKYFLLSSARFHEKITILDYLFCNVIIDEFVWHYVHNNQIGVVVVGKSQCAMETEEQLVLLRKIALHICSTNPKYCAESDVPLLQLQKIKVQLLNTIKKTIPKKSTELYNSILKGRLKKALGEEVLMMQTAVFDKKHTIGELASQCQLKIQRFIRLAIKK